MSYFRFDPATGLPLDENLQRALKQWPPRGAHPADEDSNVVTSHWMPPVDIEETAAAYVIRADLPGVAPDAIDISMVDGALALRGERTLTVAEGAAARRSERPRGSFYRRFSLPDGIDAGAISARTENGVLTVTIPRRGAARPRRIQVDG